MEERSFRLECNFQVGKYVAKLIEFLQIQSNVSLSRVHILGHSLGAHAAGFAGASLSGNIGRITAMDPARPGFESPIYKDQKDRLDPSDAAFVDVIHTCAGTLGFSRALGHADFYPNGGTFSQPGCATINSRNGNNIKFHSPI
uniref:phospholipase A1 n=1 Tax=Bracon brevicornis TaxID=1563983 RepID=A0A6V7JJ22_9HYME